MKKAPATTAKRQPQSNTATGKLKAFLEAVGARETTTLELIQEVGTTRPASLATEARKRYGLELNCDIIRNANGTAFGIYRATPTDRIRIREILGGGTHA